MYFFILFWIRNSSEKLKYWIAWNVWVWSQTEIGSEMKLTSMVHIGQNISSIMQFSCSSFLSWLLNGQMMLMKNILY